MFLNTLLSFRGWCRCVVFQSPFMIRSTTKHERWVQDPNMIYNGLFHLGGPSVLECANTSQRGLPAETGAGALADRRPPCVEWQWHDPGWSRWRNCKQLSADLVFLKERMGGSYYYRVPFNMYAALRTDSSEFWESVCHYSLKEIFFSLFV